MAEHSKPCSVCRKRPLESYAVKTDHAGEVTCVHCPHCDRACDCLKRS